MTVSAARNRSNQIKYNRSEATRHCAFRLSPFALTTPPSRLTASQLSRLPARSALLRQAAEVSTGHPRPLHRGGFLFFRIHIKAALFENKM